MLLSSHSPSPPGTIHLFFVSMCVFFGFCLLFFIFWCVSFNFNAEVVFAQVPLANFPHSAVGKEFTSNAGDPSLIPGSRRSPGEGIGYPLQCSWASLVAQLVKNLAAMWETWVWSLGREDPLEKGKATHSSILAWRIVQSMGWQRVGHNWVTFTSLSHWPKKIIWPSPKLRGLEIHAIYHKTMAKLQVYNTTIGE